MSPFAKKITIGGRPISAKKKPLVIAELSGNHGGSLDQALALLDACAAGGAEMVKFQTYTPDTITLNSHKPAFIVGTELWKDRSLYDLYQDAHTPFDWHPALFNHARKLGMIPLSSPFDDSAVDLLESLDCPAYKIASCEMVDFGLIRRVAATGKPVILSTGASALSEIEAAVSLLSELGVKDLLLLHCVSSYPADARHANLSTIPALAERFGCLVGFSDHTMGLSVPIAATALGAVAIEKHVRLDSDTSSVDSAFSLPASKIGSLMQAANEARKSLGTPRKVAYECEADSLRFRRSLYVTRDMKKGDLFTNDTIKSVRPTGGLHTRYRNDIISASHKVSCDISAGTPLSQDLIEGWSKPKNILITSAANKWALVRLFTQAAKSVREGHAGPIHIIAADMDAASKAADHADGFFTLPPDDHRDHKQALLTLCRDQDIDMIIPTRDGELMQMASYAEDLAQAGIILPLADQASLAVCLDKIDFHQHCLDHGFPVAPRLAPEDIDDFPLFVRRRNGAGGHSAFLVKNRAQLRGLTPQSDWLIQPHINAPEYSCDILSDMTGHVQHVVVRQRLKVKGGESIHSRIKDKPVLKKLAKQVAESLHMKGHSLVQIFDCPDNGPQIIEMNARFGGGSYLSITGGLNSPEWLIGIMTGENHSTTEPFTTQIGLESKMKGDTIQYSQKNPADKKDKKRP